MPAALVHGRARTRAFVAPRRYACDSSLPPSGAPHSPAAHSPGGKGGKGRGGKGGGGKGGESPSAPPGGKARLHAALREAGYTMVLSANKGSGARGQGATDVDVACCCYEVAGAFAAAPVATSLVLVGGDSDFRPALSRVLSARPEMEAAVVADRSLLSASYYGWLRQDTHRARHVPLDAVLGKVAPTVVDLRGAARPRDSLTGRADAAAAAAAAAYAVALCSEPLSKVTLNLSGEGEPAWTDAETQALVEAMLPSGRAHAACSRLGGLWLHHTEVGDASCAALARLLPHTPMLREVHLSDSAVGLGGLAALAEAARAVGRYTRPDGAQQPAAAAASVGYRLYINVRHLSGAAAVSVATAFSDCIIVKLTDPARARALLAAAGGDLVRDGRVVGAPGAAAAGRGRGGKGSPGGKGASPQAPPGGAGRGAARGKGASTGLGGGAVPAPGLGGGAVIDSVPPHWQAAVAASADANATSQSRLGGRGGRSGGRGSKGEPKGEPKGFGKGRGGKGRGGK